MSKKGIRLSFIILFTIFFTNCLSFLILETPTQVNDKNEKKINNATSLKSSSYTVTEEWYYSSSTIEEVDISLDGNYIVISQNSRNNLTLFHKSSNKTLWNTDIMSTTINSFDISADGKYISVGDTGKVYLFNNTETTPDWSKTFMWMYSTGYYMPLQVALSGDGRYTAAIQEYSLILLDNTLKSPKWFYLGSSVINSVDIGYNPINGKYYIAIGDQAGNVTLFDETNNIPLWWNETGNPINSLKISDDGSYVFAKISDDKVYFFDNSIETPKSALWTYSALDANYVNIDISADGKNVIIVEETKIHYLNNTVTDPKQQEWEVQATPDYLRKGSISGDGNYILVGIQEYDPWALPFGLAKLYNNINAQPKLEDWSSTKGADIIDVAINGFGNYFALIDDSYKLHFYHHDVPIPTIPGGGGDDDDDDDEEAAVPFGNYYLIFAIITTVSLIVIMKKKLVFKT